jgi:CRISPR-associated protein Csb2
VIRVHVTFLTKTVVISRADGSSEWPPDPARVFMAAVSAYHSNPNQDKREALEWLEGLGSPNIRTINRTPSVSRVAEWVPSSHFEMQNASFHLEEKKKVQNACGHQAFESHESKRRVSRERDVIFLPTPERVTYAWQAARPEERIIRAMSDILADIAYVGASSSLADVEIDSTDDVEGFSYVPDPSGGLIVRTLDVGLLSRLEAAYERSVSPRRMMNPRGANVYEQEEIAAFKAAFVPGSVRYADVSRPAADERKDVIVMPVRAFSASDILRVVRRVRREFQDPYGPNTPSWITGHRPDGSRDVEHVKMFPVFSGELDPSSVISGIGIVIPDGIPDQERKDFLIKVRRAGNGDYRRLVPPSLRLRSSSRKWRTATPLVLVRHPKRADDVQKVMLDSLEKSGLPVPESIKIVDGPRFPRYTTDHSSDRGNGPVTAPQYHVTVTFRRPVLGPVLAGKGRYVGYGLFVPEA